MMIAAEIDTPTTATPHGDVPSKVTSSSSVHIRYGPGQCPIEDLRDTLKIIL